MSASNLGVEDLNNASKKSNVLARGSTIPSYALQWSLAHPDRSQPRWSTQPNSAKIKCIAQQEVLRWSNWSRHKLDRQIWRKAQHCIVSGQSCLLTKQWGFVWVNSSCSWRGFWWSFKNVIQCEQKNLFALWMGWRTILSQKKLGWHHTTPHPPIQASWSIWPVEVCKCNSWHFWQKCVNNVSEWNF